MAQPKFAMFAYYPEAFIQETSKLINEQKASQVIEHIRYNILDETFDSSVFTDDPESGKLSDKRIIESEKGVYHYVKVDSDTEKVQGRVGSVWWCHGLYQIAKQIQDFNAAWRLQSWLGHCLSWRKGQTCLLRSWNQGVHVQSGNWKGQNWPKSSAPRLTLEPWRKEAWLQIIRSMGWSIPTRNYWNLSSRNACIAI